MRLEWTSSNMNNSRVVNSDCLYLCFRVGPNNLVWFNLCVLACSSPFRSQFQKELERHWILQDLTCLAFQVRIGCSFGQRYDPKLSFFEKGFTCNCYNEQVVSVITNPYFKGCISALTRSLFFVSLRRFRDALFGLVRESSCMSSIYT